MSDFTDAVIEFDSKILAALEDMQDQIMTLKIRTDDLAGVPANSTLAERLNAIESIARDGVNKAQDVQHEVRSVVRAEIGKMYEDYRSGLEKLNYAVEAIESKAKSAANSHRDSLDDHRDRIDALRSDLESIRDERVIHLRDRVVALENDVSILKSAVPDDIADLHARIIGLENREAARAEKAATEQQDAPDAADDWYSKIALATLGKHELAGTHSYLLEGVDGERVDEVIGTYSTMLDAMAFVAWWKGAHPTLDVLDGNWFANEGARQWINGRWRITELPHDSRPWSGDNE